MRLRDEGSRLSGRQIETPNNGVRNPFAALALEGKDITEQRTDVFGERGLEQPPRAVQPSFHGLRAEPEKVRRLFDAHVFDSSRDENGAKLLGEIINGAFQQLADLALRHGTLWVRGLMSGQWEWNDLRLRRARWVDLRGGEFGPAASPLQGFVEHNSG